MPVNDTTANRAYQKPNIANTLADDVGRLRSALDAIDTDMASKAPSAGPTFTGVTTVAAGSAAAPSLTFTGATSDTGLYSPGADQVAISTGGTGRLFVDSDGNVTLPAGASLGINGASPQSPADVISNASGYAISLRGRSSDSLAQLRFASNNHASVYAALESAPTYLAAQVNGSERLRITSTGALNFVGAGTAGSTQAVSFNGSAPVNSFVIDSSGRLGIGTSAPDYTLEIGQSGGPQLNLRNTNNSSSGVISGTVLGTVGFAGTDIVTWASPDARVAASIVGVGEASWTGTTSTHKGGLAFYTQADSATGKLERLRITNGGLVGVGTTSPGALVHVYGSNSGATASGTLVVEQGSAPSIQILSANSQTQEIRFGDPEDNDIGRIQYSHVDDSMRIVANAAERARIDSSGNVGIGTSSPGARLQVSQPAGAKSYSSSVLDFSAIHLDGSHADETSSALTFGSGGGGGAALAFSRDGSYGTFISLWTNNTAAANAATERLRITSAGNVGIGTSSPGYVLDVGGAGQAVPTINCFGPSIDNNWAGGIRFASNDGTTVTSKIQASTSGLFFEYGGTERLRITSTGRVGVGTASPTYEIELAQGTGASAYLNLRGNNESAGNGFIIGQDTSGLTRLFQDGNKAITFWTGSAASERMRLDSSGRVGVGTTSPTYEIELARGTGASAYLNLRGNNESAANGFIIGQDTSGLTRLFQGGNKAITFWTGSAASERMRLDSSGRLGVGTTSPGGTLDVKAAASTTPLIIQGPSGEFARIDSSGRVGIGTSSPESPLEVQAAANGGATANDGIRVYAANRSQYANFGYNGLNATNNLTFSIADTERARITSSGRLGIGTSSPGTVLDVTDPGTGLRFANAASGNFNIGLLGGTISAEAYIFQRANSPLILGTNNTERARITSTGNMLLGGTSSPTSAVSSFCVFNGTAPTASVVNGVVLYAEDVSSSSELKVRDEAGNVTTLSPHNFDLIPEGPSEDMAWSYYSERDGKRINVDMLKAIRLLEQLTGEKLVYSS